MKNLPIGIQTFRKIIERDYIYVDKTQIIHDLFARGGSYYFLSRPQSFGKSVLITTLAEIFSGNKELFKGLWIYDQIEWTQYPVIHLDLSNIDFETPGNLKESLVKFLDSTALSFDITLAQGTTHKERFSELIKKLSVKNKVVILIDEYDKPLIHYVEDEKIEIAKEIRDILKSFYGVIKSMDAYLRFVFLTGVSKFAKVSIFSDLNNLVDITLSEKYSTLLGYTETELQHYFTPYIEPMAQKMDLSVTGLSDIIRKWYNGYSWDGKNFVYNPFSILNLFNNNSFGNYWFSTGTPTFLIKLIRDRQSEPREFEDLPVREYSFDSYDFEKMDMAGLLFQTGYLTIKKITTNDLVKTYHLAYPNQEVRDSFLTHLFREYTQKDLGFGTRFLDRLKVVLDKDDIDQFIQEIKSLFASIPYHIFMSEREAYYHTVIYLLLRLSGANVTCEDPTNIGRIDAVLETAQKVYVMEFKLGSEQEALAQIKKMKYAEKYQDKGKEIILLGIGIDPGKRNISDWVLEKVVGKQ